MAARDAVNLGLRGRSAIVCASSGGLGRACAEALLDEGARVLINGRDAGRLDAAAAALDARWPGQVRGVGGDAASVDGRARLLDACPEPDILVVNGDGPEPAAFDSLDERAWTAALDSGMIGPLMLIRAVVGGMCARGFGRIVVIGSAMVTTPRIGLALSSGSRAGLIAALKGLVFEAAAANVTINSLSPERFDTGRQRRMAERALAREGVTWDAARARQTATVPAGRLGRPDEFGAACAFLCGAQAGYITGVNLRLDGGSYPGLL